jgi:hypothetical protein
MKTISPGQIPRPIIAARPMDAPPRSSRIEMKIATAK